MTYWERVAQSATIAFLRWEINVMKIRSEKYLEAIVACEKELEAREAMQRAKEEEHEQREGDTSPTQQAVREKD
jgi:hypothetical protein